MKPVAASSPRPRATVGVATATALTIAGVYAPPASAITQGVATNAFQAVGRGVQVAPDWVLTVQHAALSPSQFYVNGFGKRTVAQRYDAPGSAFPANDLALLRLAAAPTAAGFLEVADSGLGDADFAPVPVTIVSSGNVPGGSAARAYGTTTVQRSRVLIDPDDSGPLPPVTANYLISVDDIVHVQSGDSGGGLFAGHVQDSGVLVGMSSALFTPIPEGFTGSGFVQPGAYRAWIDAVMQADTADTEMLRWVSNPVPEPATWALWAGGLAALALALRRRTVRSPAGGRRRQAADPYFTEQP